MIAAVPMVFLFALDGWADRPLGHKGHSKANCVVRDFALAARIEKRRPLGQFSPRIPVTGTGRVAAFIMLDCLHAARLEFRFERNGNPYHTVKTKVRPSRNWRSWASVRALPGAWHVFIRADGEEILREKFLVR